MPLFFLFKFFSLIFESVEINPAKLDARFGETRETTQVPGAVTDETDYREPDETSHLMVEEPFKRIAWF